MKPHAISYPSLQRRLIAARRSRAFFLPRTTRHVRSLPRQRLRFRPPRASLARELACAALALSTVLTWGLLLILLAG